MILKKKIPNDFYKLFRTKNREAYMQFVTAIYEENNEVYASLGLTQEECALIIENTIEKSKIVWQEEDDMEEGETPDALFPSDSPSGMLNHLIRWGWLKSDFDEKLNTCVISFPEYSQLYVELFKKLQSDDDSRERESMLSIYSALFTYHSDNEKNNDILKSALRTSKSLGQLLSNMQDGMRSYFDELSSQKHFIGIQQVLVEEINNSDSKKYAILTTTDSVYRYKEAVKELIDQNLAENELRQQELEQKIFSMSTAERETLTGIRLQRALTRCEEASDLIVQIEREFDAVEKRYNRLIEQKTIFASRAAARIRYLLQEGDRREDKTLQLVNLLSRSDKKEEIIQDLAEKIQVTSPFRVITEKSLYTRRDSDKEAFAPAAVQKPVEEPENGLEEFVLKPLYTHREIDRFRRQHMKHGVFEADSKDIQSVEDLEKLFFVWQEATELAEGKQKIEVGEELVSQGDTGFKFSRLTIEEKN